MRECHQALKTSSYEQFKNINRNRVQGTCMWVLEHQKYIRWQQSLKDDLLWISADPGCGKSVLAKSLIDNELQATDTHSICYFFFKDNNEQNSLATALCALLHQLFGRRPPLLRHAMVIWEKNGEKVQDEVDELWRILHAAATDPVADGVTCVLDALDECREDDSRTLIRFLTDFYTRSCQKPSRKSQLKFLVTSRPYSDIELDFEGIPSNLPAIRLSGEDQNEEIRDEINLVIKERVSTVSRELRLDQMLKDLLEEKLLTISH